MVFVGALSIFGYGAKGWYDAKSQAQVLVDRAQKAIAEGRGSDSLSKERLRILLLVQDPGFYSHSGVDLTTPGAGITTLTQSLSKRLAFENFTPGIGKIRQTGYALGLDSVLTKDQQIALFLETLGMGASPEGWVTGFHKASEVFFGAAPSEISLEQYYALVAVLIAPSQLKLSEPDEKLQERVERIERLAAGSCEPTSLTDVWLEGCA